MKSVWCRPGDAPREPLHYTECGLEDVYLASGYERKPGKRGDNIIVHNLEGLYEAIGTWLVRERKLLSPSEARFLRRQIDLSQSQLALMLGCDAQTVARWEKGKTEISGPADRMLRTLFMLKHSAAGEIEGMLDRIAEIDAKLRDGVTFGQRANKRWVAEAA